MNNTPNESKTDNANPVDPFDPARLRMTEATQIGVKKGGDANHMFQTKPPTVCTRASV